MNIKNINWGYLTLSLLCALMLWTYVTIRDNPVEEQLFEVPIDYINLADNLAISDKTENIKLRLSGTANVLDNLTASDINVYVDLSAATIGQHTSRLNYDLPNNVQLASAERTEVTVLIDEQAQVQKAVAVEYAAAGNLAEGYMPLTCTLSPNEVILSGPEDKLALIDKIFVTVNLDGANANYRANLPVNVQDAAGNSLLSWVNVQPSQIDVLVPVVTQQPTKTVPVNVTISGQPAEGYVVSRIVADPAVATITGAQNDLDKVDYVYTSAVNISGASGNITEDVTLLNADGITVDRNRTFRVVVVIEKESSKTINDVVISLTNTKANYNYNLSTNTVNVTVQGPESAINSITSTDITAQLNASDFKTGSNQAFLQLTSKSNVEIRSAQPLFINVEVSPKDGEAQ